MQPSAGSKPGKMQRTQSQRGKKRMRFTTLKIVYNMLRDNVLDLEQERMELKETMELRQGMYEVADEDGDIDAQHVQAELLEDINKEFQKVTNELRAKKEALQDIENAELF